jgi:hypothetical protein
VTGNDPAGLLMLFRAKRGVSLDWDDVSEKGWAVRSKSGSPWADLRLERDTPLGWAEIASADPDFEQTPTFDEFLVVQAVGRRILVWTETTGGVRTLRIDYTMTVGEWQETIAVPGEYVYAGLVGRQANIAEDKTSNPMEFRGFEVKRLPGGGGMGGRLTRPAESRADRNRMGNPAMSTPGGRVDQTGRPGGCDVG